MIPSISIIILKDALQIKIFLVDSCLKPLEMRAFTISEIFMGDSFFPYFWLIFVKRETISISRGRDFNQ